MTCILCDATIHPQRLAALPRTETCIDCAQTLERIGAAYRVRESDVAEAMAATSDLTFAEVAGR